MSIKPLALPYLLLASGIKIVYKDREHDSSVQKHFPSFNFSNRHRKCTLLERCNAFFSTLKFVCFFLPWSHPLLKQGRRRKHLMRTLPLLPWIYSAHHLRNYLQKQRRLQLQPRLHCGLSHTFCGPPPWLTGSSLGAWEPQAQGSSPGRSRQTTSTSSASHFTAGVLPVSCLGKAAGKQVKTSHICRNNFVKLNYLHWELGWISSPSAASVLTQPVQCPA